jgi:hypothetical protein
MSRSLDKLSHLPRHLQEVCAILARGIIRARLAEAKYNSENVGVSGEISLHSPREQSAHAEPKLGRTA